VERSQGKKKRKKQYKTGKGRDLTALKKKTTRAEMKIANVKMVDIAFRGGGVNEKESPGSAKKKGGRLGGKKIRGPLTRIGNPGGESVRDLHQRGGFWN